MIQYHETDCTTKKGGTTFPARMLKAPSWGGTLFPTKGLINRVLCPIFSLVYKGGTLHMPPHHDTQNQCLRIFPSRKKSGKIPLN